MAMLLEINQIGVKEDLADLIAIADMKATPFITMVPKGAAPVNTYFSWQVDNYLPPNVGAGVLDGTDVTSSNYENEVQNRSRIGGRVEKMWRVPAVSDFSENVSEVAGLGRQEEMANAVAKAIEELKRDMEASLCSDQPSQIESGTNPYLTRGLGIWINTTPDNDLPVPAEYLTPTGSIITGLSSSALTEVGVQNQLQSIYQQTGQMRDFEVLCSPNLKRMYTQFALFEPQSSSVMPVRRYSDSDGEITASIDVFHGDFGTQRLHPSLWLGYSANGQSQDLYRGYCLDMEKLSLRYNRRPRFFPLPDFGGGPRGIVDCIFGLQVNNPLQHGKFTT